MGVVDFYTNISRCTVLRLSDSLIFIVTECSPICYCMRICEHSRAHSPLYVIHIICNLTCLPVLLKLCNFIPFCSQSRATKFCSV